MQQSRNIWLAFLAVIVIAGGLIFVRANHSQKSVPTATTQTVSAQTAAFAPHYPCTAGKTALAALQDHYPVDTKDTSFGKQIMAINHIQPADKQFWSFYLDGKSASVGADSYQCKGSETVDWKLESF